MPKKYFAAFILFLWASLGFPLNVYAAIQTGIEAQLKNDVVSLDTAKLNWWLTENFAFGGSYSWDTGNLGFSTIYQLNPKSSTSFYLGLAGNDLTGKMAPLVPISEKLNLIAGVEFDLTRNKPGWSIMVEAGINPNEFNNQSVVNHEFGSKIGISLNYRFSPTKPTKVASNYNVNLLAQLVTLEARNEPFEGQVAVAAVVLNRTHSRKFPDSIQGVVYQPGQFKPAARLRKTKPDETALRAAKAALGGSDPSHGALYFYNPAISSVKAKNYIKQNNFTVTARIGNHVFYR